MRAEFRKKPVPVYAEEFLGTTRSASSLLDWAAEFDVEFEYITEGTDCSARRNDERHLVILPLSEGGPTWVINEDAPPILLIYTLEGVMRADVGDWIIKGVENEFYPCKPDIFARTYERI